MVRKQIVLVIFYDSEGKMLLHNRADNPEYWSLLGGSVEENEEPVEAIKREMREEIGHEFDESLSFIQSIMHSNLDGEKEYELHVYKADFPGFERFVDTEEVKISELKLFTKDEIKDLKKLLFADLVLSRL